MASRGVNRITLVGNLGGDPDCHTTGSGTAITRITVATSESWVDKQSGEKQERTEWHRVKFFGRLAEIAGEYLKKGRQVYIEGSLRTDKYTDKEGIERYSTDIIASEMQMLGGAAERGSDRADDHGQGQRSQGHEQSGRQSQPARNGNQNAPRGNGTQGAPRSNGNGNQSAARGNGNGDGRQQDDRGRQGNNDYSSAGAGGGGGFEDDVPFRQHEHRMY